MVRESWSRNVRRWTQEVPHRVSAVTVDWLSKWTTASSQQQSTSISSTTTMNSKTSITPSTAVSTKVVVSKSSLDARTRHLLNSISIANCNHSRHRDVEELCKFLRQYPVAQSLAAKVCKLSGFLSFHLQPKTKMNILGRSSKTVIASKGINS